MKLERVRPHQNSKTTPCKVASPSLGAILSTRTRLTRRATHGQNSRIGSHGHEVGCVPRCRGDQTCSGALYAQIADRSLVDANDSFMRTIAPGRRCSTRAISTRRRSESYRLSGKSTDIRMQQRRLLYPDFHTFWANRSFQVDAGGKPTPALRLQRLIPDC